MTRVIGLERQYNIHSFIYSFNKHLPSSSDMPNTILGARDPKTKKTGTLRPEKLYLAGGVDL